MSLPLPDQPSRNRSASAGDSGLPKHENKRPRLSENHSSEQQTVATAQPTDGKHSSTLQSPMLPSTPTNAATSLVSPPQSPLLKSESPSAVSPKSKVTINTRPLSSQSFAVQAQSENADGNMESTTRPSPEQHPSETPAQSHHGHEADHISISSSESGSPLIQVAQPEDLDRDPAKTQWEPISHPLVPSSTSIGPGYVQRTFPFVDQYKKGSAHAVVMHIASCFFEGSHNDDAIFEKVKTWMVDFVNNATDLDLDFFAEDRDFWLKLPSLITNLLRRTVDPPSRVQSDDLVDLFVAFCHITTLIVNADTGKLRSYSETTDPRSIIQPYCVAYFPPVRWIMSYEGVPLYNVLQQSFNYDLSSIIDATADRVIESHALGYINSLMHLFQAAADLFTKRVALLESAITIIDHARLYVQVITRRSSSFRTSTTNANGSKSDLLNVSTEFLQSIDAILDRAITKQQPWLNIETCDRLLKQVSMLIDALALSFPTMAIDLVHTACIEPSSFTDEDKTVLASTAWRFTSLLKLLKKGRMEVRVACIQIMGEELVDVYQRHIAHNMNDLKHWRVRFMVQFLRGNNILQYIISVDSHPQIINRCSNIIGFLCVSHGYLNKDTDTIWQAVSESQDPRTIVEILTVFQINFDHLKIGALSHLALKLFSLPLERFDVPMLDFATSLLNIVNYKALQSNISQDEKLIIDEYTFKFYFKLLREASIPDQICAEMPSRIRQSISQSLQKKIELLGGVLTCSGETDPLRPMLIELCNAIREHTESATGALISLSSMFSRADSHEIRRVVGEHKIADLLIADMINTCHESVVSVSSDGLLINFDYKTSLLVMLLSNTPESIVEPLIADLWTQILASTSVDPRLRSMTWRAAGNVFENCRVRNSALDILVEQYLPMIPPSLYDAAILHFVKQSVKYEMQQSPAELMEEQTIVTIPGVERVWNIVLKALPNTVEILALQFIIELYLDSDRILRRDLLSTEATHLALIDHCVQRVIDAARHLKTASNDVQDANGSAGSTADILSGRASHAVVFHRSLLFLRTFLSNLKTRPRYTPAKNDNLRSTLDTFEPTGQTFEVTLQIIGHKTLASIQHKWALGMGNTGAELWQYLSDVTGWSQFSVINGGKKIALQDEPKLLQDLDIKPGSLMINKILGTQENTPARMVRATSPVDNKVMHHFDELYGLLELEDSFAKEVFDFLRMFSSQEGVLQKLKSMTLAPDQLLPVEKPFKLMYYARALRSCIEDESFSSDPNSDFLAYGIRTILSTLPRLNELQVQLKISISIAQGLIEALILAFRARVPSNVSLSYIEDGPAFVDNILTLWSRALSLDDSQSDSNTLGVVMLARSPFEVLIEGVLHDERLWDALPYSEFAQQLQHALLTHHDQAVRQATLEVVYGLTGVSSSKLVTKINDSRAPVTRFPAATVNACLGHMWKILSNMTQEADSNWMTCEEYFDAFTSVFRKYRSHLKDDEVIAEVASWKDLLLTHQYHHVVGTPLQDFFTSSVGRLLKEAIKTLPPSAMSEENGPFIGQLLSSFLFPPVRDHAPLRSMHSLTQQTRQDPILDMYTRSVLYDLILVLNPSKNSLNILCKELTSNLTPNILYFQPNSNNERQSLRSEVGYLGLRNLSNTCYLNSLISQLFMNVEFRELIMNVNIIDRSKQKLVAELGRIFAYMQKSYEEAVNPETVVDAITLWDGDQIDITLQMDVDEFYNLLFDRLESQIVDPKVCNVFKSIYGGQLVQQIKSKECEHVSERLEPFAAVQVEIKGKATLEESLRTYVEGEVLQGENKYSCTGCGRHVDAVKRACLKTVPDHLIFNLKRFDYDIMTGTRCKVNDEFGFPDVIDIAPYTLDALTNSESSCKPDLFELVGIIVHSGTAESGHYYSYIRQRPSTKSKDKSWMQFNDHDVTPFDPAGIRECCFGGIDFGPVQCARFYNGYMLFYQRAASIQKFEQAYPEHSSAGPVCLPIAVELESDISHQNDCFLRTFVAQDPTHAKFMRCLLQQKQFNMTLRCPQHHDHSTTTLILTTLDYVNQLSARWKDLPEVEETLNLLRSFATECDQCAMDILKWLSKNGNLVDNLLRSCYLSVRKGFMVLTLTAWNTWALAARRNEHISNTAYAEYERALSNFLNALADGWEHLQRHGRAWEQYFSVLIGLLQMGEYEARAIIEAGFLEFALEFVVVHATTANITKRLRLKYQMYLLHRERNRQFGHQYLTKVLAEMLQFVDLNIPASKDHGRIRIGDRIGPSTDEAALLNISSHPGQLIWLRKIIVGRSNPDAADKIVQYLCEVNALNGLLMATLKDGLNDRDILVATAFLQPTITFVANCSTEEALVEVVEEALDCIGTTQGQYGKDFQIFVQQLLHIGNAQVQIQPGELATLVKQRINNWAPTLLMAPNDMHADVRSVTVEMVNEILLADMDVQRTRSTRLYNQDVGQCRSLAQVCAEHARETFLNSRTSNLQAGQANQAMQIVDECLRYFDNNNAADEETVGSIQAIMEEFKARSDGVVETVTEADWNASSDLEVMSDGSEASN